MFLDSNAACRPHVLLPTMHMSTMHMSTMHMSTIFTMHTYACSKHMLVVGGRYGLASKEFTPAMAAAVFDNLALPTPKSRFTVRAEAARQTC